MATHGGLGAASVHAVSVDTQEAESSRHDRKGLGREEGEGAPLGKNSKMTSSLIREKEGKL